MFEPDDFGYDDYEPSPYFGDDLDGGAHFESPEDDLDPEDFEEDDSPEEDGPDIDVDAPDEQEDQFLDAAFEDRHEALDYDEDTSF